jgi:hypothetical protein
MDIFKKTTGTRTVQGMWDEAMVKLDAYSDELVAKDNQFEAQRRHIHRKLGHYRREIKSLRDLKIVNRQLRAERDQLRNENNELRLRLSVFERAKEALRILIA